ncbi:hypothetical protein CFC21_040660 [Triticum aestivum]|uniref:F-box domain-containing protein n=3 Tax=Triticum TaxID=4564 RepID=A0A9R1RZW6_TRITD|nr:uncharacterized protein LOC123065193 isoform X1 [Triticum aestivum]KAF7028798.1 hypothetical protein CFC21_040660 [Triticum aestivum]VAH74707.1 unnamed protein product [Triticum turgidum subsp. durum]
MDMTGQLPEDMLLDVLRRLSPRSLAACRCVRKEWRTDLLPLSLDGVFLELRDPDLPLERMEHPMPALFSRRTTARRIAASLGYPDTPCIYECGVQDCCNGLLLLLCDYVVNPATLQWVELPTAPRRCCFLCMSSPYLVFDPTVSQHYEVLSVPDIPWNLPTGHISKHACMDKPVSEMEWPPSPYIVNVFSSRAGEWKQRSFVREGKAAGTVAECRSKERRILRYAAYWHGALYVSCEDNFVLRMNLSNDKYQVIQCPQGKKLESYAPRLGKSKKGVYCAFRVARDAFQVWFLNETDGKMEWVLNNDINFEHVSKCPRNFVRGPWILQGSDNNEELVEDNSEWDPNNDNVVSAEDWVVKYGSNSTIDFLGFHPYKEIALFESTGHVMAYHMNTSTVRDLGHIKMGRNEIECSFPYMPCWMGPLPRSHYRTQFCS